MTDQKQTMLYRLDGEPERGVMPVEIEGAACQCRVFEDDQLDEASARGWVSHDGLLEFIRAERAGEQPGAEASTGGEQQAPAENMPPVEGDDVETIDLTDIYGELESLSKSEAKKRLDEWALAEHDIKLDRRLTLDDMKAELEQSLADGE